MEALIIPDKTQMGCLALWTSSAYASPEFLFLYIYCTQTNVPPSQSRTWFTGTVLFQNSAHAATSRFPLQLCAGCHVAVIVCHSIIQTDGRRGILHKQSLVQIDEAEDQKGDGAANGDCYAS